jgi:hypothetical protein
MTTYIQRIIPKFCKLFPHFCGVANPFMSHCHKTDQRTTTYHWMFNADVLCLLLFGVATKSSEPLQKKLTTFG